MDVWYMALYTWLDVKINVKVKLYNTSLKEMKDGVLGLFCAHCLG